MPHLVPQGKVCTIVRMTQHRRSLRRIEARGHARYLTFSCYRRLPLFGNDSIKQVFIAQLAWVCRRLSVALYAWVVMPEHVHVLLMPHPPRVTVTGVLGALKRPVAARVLGRWRELNAPILPRLIDPRGHAHFWQRGGGYDRNITTPHELYEKISYIHHNPVRRGLVDRPIDWPWSSAGWYERRDGCGVPVDPLPA